MTPSKNPTFFRARVWKLPAGNWFGGASLAARGGESGSVDSGSEIARDAISFSAWSTTTGAHTNGTPSGNGQVVGAAIATGISALDRQPFNVFLCIVSLAIQFSSRAAEIKRYFRPPTESFGLQEVSSASNHRLTLRRLGQCVSVRYINSSHESDSFQSGIVLAESRSARSGIMWMETLRRLW